MFTLGSWLSKVLSGTIKKHPINTHRHLWSSLEKMWISRHGILETIRQKRKEINDKINDLDPSSNPEDRSKISALSNQLVSIVPSTIRSVIKEKLTLIPKFKTEVRYLSPGFGAIHTNKLLMEISSEWTELQYGITILMRIRAGRYWTASSLAKIGLINERFKKKCPFCNRNDTPETVHHYVNICEFWDDDREKTLNDIKVYNAGAPPSGTGGRNGIPIKFISSIMGLDPLPVLNKSVQDMGNWAQSWFRTSDKDWVLDSTLKLVRFLQSTSPKRFKKLDFC
jgi:hypothetical protein